MKKVDPRLQTTPRNSTATHFAATSLTTDLQSPEHLTALLNNHAQYQLIPASPLTTTTNILPLLKVLVDQSRCTFYYIDKGLSISHYHTIELPLVF